jgi:hypothetical protein
MALLDTKRQATGPRALVVGLFLLVTVWAIFDETALFWWPFFAVGCLLLVRAHWHPMGWILVATAVALSLALGGMPGTEHLNDDAAPWTTVFALFGYITLTFPSGLPPRGTDRWSLMTRSAIALLAVFAAVEMIVATTVVIRGEMPGNPVATLVGVGYAVTILLLAIGAISLFVRWRRSEGELRAQLSWVVAALILVMATLVVTELAALFMTEVLNRAPVGDDIYLAVGMSFLSVPISITVAILRYHLYDLGRLVRRTVSYTLLVVILVGIYALGILGFGSLGGQASPLVVAGSTLAAAGVFNPVRRRVQGWVDRRFDRQRYDAERLVVELNNRLRDHADIDVLIADLSGVVDATLRPTSLSIWVREI